MSEMYDPVILRALQKATIAAVAASSTPTLPIKGVSNGFEAPNDQKYLECVFITNNVENEHWGDEKTYQGMFRMILHWPNDGEGPYIPMNALASICSYFSKGEPLGDVRLTTSPNMLSPLEAGKENLYPASVRYSCFRF